MGTKTNSTLGEVIAIFILLINNKLCLRSNF